MFDAVVRKLFGSANDRYVRGMGSIVSKINAMEPDISKKTDKELAALSSNYRERVNSGERHLSNFCQKLLPPSGKLLKGHLARGLSTFS